MKCHVNDMTSYVTGAMRARVALLQWLYSYVIKSTHAYVCFASEHVGKRQTHVVQWILTKACFAVWTMFYDWFWYYGVSLAEISRVPIWHPWAKFFKGKNKMAARYFKVKYDFSTNEARNKCNTSFSCDFDWAIHFLYYFYDLRSSSRSKKVNLKVK